MRHHDVPDMSSTELTPKFLASQDCVIIATDHSAYDYGFVVKHAPLILDTRNATKSVKKCRDKIRKA
jgi:UDP-N-acetyl-D-glucosamine dehydrogenase